MAASEAAAPIERPEAEAAVVVSWRFRVLVQAGYSTEDAAVLAARREVDLHLAASLLERGCPAQTALEILL